MNYKGTIIAESLGNQSIFRYIKILSTRIEPVTEKHKTPWLAQWTLHWVEVPEEKADEYAKRISKTFNRNHPNWYVDFKNDNYHFIVFANKVFKVNQLNQIGYKDAKAYGISIGIPNYQLNFI